MAKKITFLDKAFWLTETNDNPKHVASLQILQLPRKAGEHYVKDLVDELREHSSGVEPFNCVVKQFLGYPVKLKTIDILNMQYHIQYHQLKDIGDRASLHKLIALLHEPRLDVDKPLWQYHVIESIEGDEFAIYVKIHHMYGDGATLIKWFQAAYKDSPSKHEFVPFWEKNHPKPPARPKQAIKNSLWSVANFFLSIKDFFWVLFRVFLKALHINTHYMPTPFTGTKTVLTGQVKAGRVVATTDLPFLRVKALSKKLRASINEVLLCCFDIAVHRFLKEYGQSFDKALFTNVPINLRKPGDNSSGNKIAIVPVELAHGEKDPYLRLRQIVENHRIVIQAAKNARPAAFSYYTIFIQSFSLVFELLRLSNLFKPIANILISNMQGPRDLRYLKDCKLKAIYPISTITPGGGVNITLLTYGDLANVGVVCCNKNIKSLEPLASYFMEAFELLEKSVDDETLSIDDIGEKVTMTHFSDVVIPDDYHPEEDRHG